MTNASTSSAAGQLDVAQLAPGLVRSADGYWKALGTEEVSYPVEGNDLCFQLEDRSFWFQHRNKVLQAALRRWPPGTGAFLDVGGGNGFVARDLENLGYPVILVEPGEAGARNAVRRGLRHVVCATLATGKFASGCAGGVGLFDVVEHIKDDVGFLKEVAATLSRDGRIYITVPAFNWLWSAEDEHAGHFRRYSRRSLRQVVEAAGLAIEFQTCFFWLLPAPVFALRTVPSFLGVRRYRPERAEKEHSLKGGWIARQVQSLLAREIGWIEQGKVIPLGGSILAVAKHTYRQAR